MFCLTDVVLKSDRTSREWKLSSSRNCVVALRAKFLWPELARESQRPQRISVPLLPLTPRGRQRTELTENTFHCISFLFLTFHFTSCRNFSFNFFSWNKNSSLNERKWNLNISMKIISLSFGSFHCTSFHFNPFNCFHFRIFLHTKLSASLGLWLRCSLPCMALIWKVWRLI